LSAAGEGEVLAKIAEMPEADRVLAERLHAIVKATAPELAPKTWYGMPAYAKDGKIVCFFQSAQKFKTRYATLGFSDQAQPRRRRHVAGHLRPRKADQSRRETNRRPHRASSQLAGSIAARRPQRATIRRMARVLSCQ
jgi:hypothetical protein